MTMNSSNEALPIAVFDSGLGGLTVLKSLREILPYENFIYLGDTARIPYGIKSSRTIAKYLEQNLHFLEKKNIKAAVVACSSASTVLNEIKADIPTYGVIEPCAYKAATLSEKQKIGVIATRTTVAKRSYVTQIQKLNPKCEVYQQACPLLVPLVEEGWDDDPITNLIVYRYLSPLISTGIDTLILGCTHYPILRPAIQKVAGASVELVESGPSVSEQMTADFQAKKILANPSSQTGTIQFFVTDISEHFLALARKIMAPFPVETLELVDI